MKASYVAAIACLAPLVPACGGRVGGTDSNVQATGDAAVGAHTQVDGASPGVLDGSDAGATDANEPPSPALTAQPTVWIGQVDTAVTFPGTETTDPAPDPWPTGPEKVVLVVDVIGTSVAGTVTFGENGPPAPPVDPSASYPLTPTMRQDPDGKTFPIIQSNWTISPYPGFTYSLVSSKRSADLLTLFFVPTELWRDWCALQPAGSEPQLNDHTDPCDCSSGTCRAQSSPMREIDLLVQGDTMQGQMPTVFGFGGGGSIPSMRLQRVP